MPRGRPSRAAVYTRLQTSLEALERLGGLPSPQESQAIWADIWHLEAHHSTALEGNTLVLREVRALLDQGRSVGSKPLKDYLEVQGYSEAATWVYRQALHPDELGAAGLISVSEVRSIHHRLMTPVWQVAPHPDASDREGPGSFREHDIQPFGGGMTPPSWTLVDSELRTWVDTVDDPTVGLSAKNDEPLPERLARVHNEFERIHPFIDGNGRTGRLVLNLILVRLGHPPVIVLKQKRDRYLDAMQKADQGDMGPLGELLARAMIDNLHRFIVPNIAGPARMVPLQALADDEFSVVALRLAALRGRLTAMQSPDGTWLSSRHAVQEYARSRYQRQR